MSRSRLTPKTSRRQVTQRWALARRWAFVLLVSILVMWGSCIGLSYARWGKITTLVIEENPHIDQVEAHKRVENILSRHWAIMGNKDRHWTLPKKRIKETLTELSNIIRSTNLSYHDHTLTIRFDIFRPAFLTCFDNGQCGFTSSDGYVYDYAPVFSQGVYPIIDVATQFPDLDTTPWYLPERERMIAKHLFDDQESPWYGGVYRVVVGELDMKIFIDTLDGQALPEQAYLFINQKNIADIHQYLDIRLSALKKKTDFFDRLHETPRKFEYLDLRFEDKIYVKFNEESF